MRCCEWHSPAERWASTDGALPMAASDHARKQNCRRTGLRMRETPGESTACALEVPSEIFQTPRLSVDGPHSVLRGSRISFPPPSVSARVSERAQPSFSMTTSLLQAMPRSHPLPAGKLSRGNSPHNLLPTMQRPRQGAPRSGNESAQRSGGGPHFLLRLLHQEVKRSAF